MKINIDRVKEKIAGFIFDLIIESGSKSKFFRKYTNHRFRKQYERVVDSCNYYWISRRNYDLEKANGRLHKEIDDLHCRLRFIYEKVKVVATEYPKNIWELYKGREIDLLAGKIFIAGYDEESNLVVVGTKLPQSMSYDEMVENMANKDPDKWHIEKGYASYGALSTKYIHIYKNRHQ